MKRTRLQLAACALALFLQASLPAMAQSITVSNATTVPGTIAISVQGTQYTLAQAQTVQISISSATTLSIWICVTNCAWVGFPVSPNQQYKVVDSGPHWGMTLVQLSYPRNAAEVKAQYPGATDGDYVIDPDGPGGNPPFTVYCYNMAGTPKEYLSLARVGEGTNYSKYPAGGARAGTDVYTHWSKLRILPETLEVNRADRTFSVSRGMLWYPPGPLSGANSIWTNWWYASASDCIGVGSSQGRANIDLRDTPFRVDPSVMFIVVGFGAAGNSSISADRKVVDSQAGGYCGSCNPGGGADSGDSDYMRLSFDPSLVTPKVAPAIDAAGQPQSQTPRTGGTATFAVTAIGTFPLSFQWRFNGANISGATNATYVIATAGISNLGMYDVVVANSAGTNTSSPASLALMDLKMLAGVYLSATNGSHYRIDAATALNSTNWTTVTNVTVTTQPFIYVDYTSPTNNQKFYRAVPQ